MFTYDLATQLNSQEAFAILEAVQEIDSAAHMQILYRISYINFDEVEPVIERYTNEFLSPTKTQETEK